MIKLRQIHGDAHFEAYRQLLHVRAEEGGQAACVRWRSR
jgi:hypothetical protein